MGAKLIRKRNVDLKKQIYQRIGNVGKKEVAVGFPKEAQLSYPDGTKVADVAFLNNYGDGDKIPERDFMGASIEDVKKVTQKIFRDAYKASKNPDEATILEAAGHAAAAVIKKTIRDFSTPGNAPYTIAKKGFDNPLVETGHMMQSVTHQVRDKE